MKTNDFFEHQNLHWMMVIWFSVAILLPSVPARIVHSNQHVPILCCIIIVITNHKYRWTCATRLRTSVRDQLWLERRHTHTYICDSRCYWATLSYSLAHSVFMAPEACIIVLFVVASRFSLAHVNDRQQKIKSQPTTPRWYWCLLCTRTRSRCCATNERKKKTNYHRDREH